jgi:5-methylcytosine-specific restriction endonuclease McrA
MATSHALTCQYEPCGKSFEAPRRRKYCEPLCERRAYSKARVADGRHRAYREQSKDKRAAYMAENADRFKVERECLVCGRTWRTQRKDAKYCSMTCRNTARAGTHYAPSRRSLARRRLARAARGTRGAAWADTSCTWCGARYVVRLRSGKAAEYCSRKCHSKAKGARRRATIRGAEREPVSRAQVFARDGWNCHLCGDPIDREAVAPEPLAPTLDHVVPLARGGSHTMRNLRPAHFICNARKSDRMDLVTAA